MTLRNPTLLLICAALAFGNVVRGDEHTQSELAAANALLGARKNAEARAAFEKILARVPDDPEANYQVGLFACDEGDWEKALRLEGKAAASDPGNARFQSGLGAANGIAALKSGVFSKLGYAKKCLAAYQRAVELAPRDLNYRFALLNYYQQAPGFAGGNLSLAYAQAEEIKRLDAERGRQAFTQLYLGEKKPDLAFRQYDEVLRTAPDDYLALYHFGRLTLQTGQRLDDGLAAFRRCLALTPPEGKEVPTHANVHWRLGNVWEKKNQPDDARVEYGNALKADPEFRPAKAALAKLDVRKS